MPRALLRVSTAALIANVVASVAALGPAAVSSPVGGQLHSYNDFRSWPQALAKSRASSRALGAANATKLLLKLDPQYLPASTCALFERAPPGDSRGCLLFNHDTITAAASSRRSLNSSADLVPALLSPALAPFFASPDNSTFVAISLCFKGSGPRGPTADWLSLVDDLFAAVQGAISTHKLSVEILLDGSGNPGATAALAQRWRPWASVFISGDDPDAAFTSSDPSRGFDRLVVLNNPAGLSFGTAAALGFGKFAGGGNGTSGPRPYICWEPSDAAGVSTAVNQWATSPAAPNPAGLRFAINIDAAQLDVHAAYAVAQLASVPPALAPFGAGWWAGLAAGGSGAPVDGSLALTPLPNDGVVIATWLAAPDNAPTFAAFSYTAPGAPLVRTSAGALPLRARPAPRAAGGVWSVSGLQLSDKSTVFVSTTASVASDGTASAFTEEALLTSVDAVTRAVSFSATSAPGAPPAGAPVTLALAGARAPLAAAVSACDAAAPPASLAAACRAWAWAPAAGAPASPCLVAGVLFGGAPGSPLAGAGSGVVCLAETADAGSALLGALAAAGVDGLALAAAPYAAGGAGGGPARLAVVAAYSGAGVTLGLTACAATAIGAAPAVGVNDAGCWAAGGAAPGSNSTTAPLASHVGAQPSVALGAPAGGASPAPAPELVVFAVHSNSSCPNNEKDNKRVDVGLCDQQPVINSGQAYLAYGYARVSAWGARLLAAAPLARAGPPPPAWPGLSPCAADVAHGSVGTGASPAAAALPLADGRLAAAVLAARLAGAAATRDPLGCGVSAPPAGADDAPLALVGWPLAAEYAGDAGPPPRLY